MRAIWLTVLLFVALLAGCFSDDGGDGTPTPTSGPTSKITHGTSENWSFDTVLVDDGYGTSEPSILAAPDGALWIVGPTGFVTPLTQQDPIPYTHDSGAFKSTDGGQTWTFNAPVPQYGRDACVGGGDSDIAASPDGTLFLIDLNLLNVPIDVSTDGGDTWLFNCNSSIIPGLDRQWVAATDDHVWISVNHLLLGPVVYRADRLGVPLDGLVFGVPQPVPAGGAIVVDQATGILYTSGSGSTVGVSTDNGDSWNTYTTGLDGVDLSGSFVSIALDAQGNVYVAGSGSEGFVFSGSKDHGETWTEAARIRPYEGEYGFGWVAAGGDGIVDYAWYGRPADNDTSGFGMDPDGFYLFAGQTTDLFEKGADATAVVSRVSDEPVTTKNLCTGISLLPPTPCDVADPSSTRALGDFFETAVDLDGNLIVAYVSEYQHDPPVLMFAKQTSGLQAPP